MLMHLPPSLCFSFSMQVLVHHPAILSCPSLQVPLRLSLVLHCNATPACSSSHMPTGMAARALPPADPVHPRTCTLALMPVFQPCRCCTPPRMHSCAYTHLSSSPSELSPSELSPSEFSSSPSVRFLAVHFSKPRFRCWFRCLAFQPPLRWGRRAGGNARLWGGRSTARAKACVALSQAW